MNPKPLGNIKVVELSTYVAAPSCARMLADMGAKVVKIEAFRGDPWRNTSMATTYTDENEIPMFDIYNAGKESICLDIKNPEGMKILMEMLELPMYLSPTPVRHLLKSRGSITIPLRRSSPDLSMPP